MSLPGARDEARGREAADEFGARFVQLDVTGDLATARIRRRRVLGGLIHEDEQAA